MMGKSEICRGASEFVFPSPLSPHPPPSRSLSPPLGTSLSPTIPSYPCNSAFELCPSLVKIYVETKSGKHISDFGFVAHRDDDITTVWGCSWFLYEDEPYEVNRAKELVHGEVFVSSNHPDFGGTSKGIVRYVDVVNDLVVIEYQNRRQDMPVASLYTLNSATMYVESFICLDYYSYLDTYVVKTYKFRDVDSEGSKMCQSHLHFDRGVQSYQGVILNSHLDIVGMKMTTCEYDEKLAHVLPIDRVFKYLSSYTFRRGRTLNDFRNCSKKETNVHKHGRIAELKKDVETFRICLREIEKKLEIALKETPQVTQLKSEYEASISEEY